MCHLPQVTLCNVHWVVCVEYETQLLTCLEHSCCLRFSSLSFIYWVLNSLLDTADDCFVNRLELCWSAGLSAHSVSSYSSRHMAAISSLWASKLSVNESTLKFDCRSSVGVIGLVVFRDSFQQWIEAEYPLFIMLPPRVLCFICL